MAGREILKNINESFIKNNTIKVTDDGNEKVVKNGKRTESKLKKRSLLDSFIEDIKLFLAIVKDYLTGKCKKIPYWVICAILFTLLYVFNPLDVIPDFIPGVGQLDAAAVIMICLRFTEEELKKYNKLKTVSV